jgi:hypothetical protein
VNEFLDAQAELGKPGVPGWWENLNLTEQQQTDLDAAARNRDISHRAIVTVLNRWGVKVTLGQVGHWRRDHVPGYGGGA